MAWFNNDGLYVRFGSEKTVVAQAWEYPSNDGLRRIHEFRIDTSLLTTTPTILPGFNGEDTPRNSYIEEVEYLAETAVTTLTSFNVGFKRLDRSTELDHDGLIAGALLATVDAAGERTTLTKGSTGAGALIGTTLAYPGLPVAYIAGSAGTGIIRVRVKLYVPGKDANPTNF